MCLHDLIICLIRSPLLLAESEGEEVQAQCLLSQRSEVVFIRNLWSGIAVASILLQVCA